MGLIYVSQVNSVVDMDFILFWFFFVDDYVEQGGFIGVVGVDNVDDGIFGDGVVEVFIQYVIVE